MIRKDDFTKKNLSEIVVEYIKEKILTGEYKEGDRVSEVKIAEELEISRSPVREGIKELQNQGLIKFLPRKGNFVSSMTIDDIKEIFEVRLMIENDVLAILLNEKKLTDEDFKKMTELINEMVRITNEDGEIMEKTIRINEKDIEFHKLLWEKSGSKRRMKILSDLYYQLQMAMVIDTKLTGNLEITAKDHYEIIECLKKGDLENAKKALKDHIITFRKGVFEQKSSYKR